MAFLEPPQCSSISSMVKPNGWVGDSRAYLVRGRRVLERTRDHKLVEELIEAGQLTADQAKDSSLAHVITQALGGRPPGDRPVKATLLGHPWKLAHGDRIVLCSDGVSDLVEDEELADVVSDGTPEDATYKLLEMSLARGGHDNITAIVLSWDGEDYVEDDVATPAFISREAYPDTDLLRATGEPPTPDDGPPGTVTEEIDPSWRPDDDDEEDTGITSRMIFGDPDAAKPPADSAAETWPPAPPPVSAEDGEHDQGTDQTIESSSSETTANWMLYVAGIVAVLVVFGLVLGLR